MTILGGRLRRSHAAVCTGTLTATSAQAKSQTGLTLDLPNDQYTRIMTTPIARPGVVAQVAQIPLATISGCVYHDRSATGVSTLQTEQASAASWSSCSMRTAHRRHTTTISTDPAKLDFTSSAI
jgi:hypothetical protein